MLHHLCCLYVLSLRWYIALTQSSSPYYISTKGSSGFFGSGANAATAKILLDAKSVWITGPCTYCVKLLVTVEPQTLGLILLTAIHS